MDRPRIMIAGERSGVGKSTITIGILLALKAKGLEVQPFKNGPDFLDPMHHNETGDRVSRNLDTWMFPDWVPTSFHRASSGADISVVEGSMGLYDGMGGRSEEGSSAFLAKRLRCPVILVIDARSCSRSAGAVAKGFKTFDPAVDVRGVIFNQVGGRDHLGMLEEAIEGLGLIGLGGIPRNRDACLESRHLGLVPAKESDNRERYDEIRKMVEDNLDLEMLLDIARGAPEWEHAEEMTIDRSGNFRLAVARDAAFNFYYEDNLDIMRSLGASITTFSPIDGDLPDADGYYLGGGYPELHLDAMEANDALRSSLLRRMKEGTPVYAECGGLMYLCRKVKGQDGRAREMAGVFDAEVEMTPKLQALGYVEAECVADSVLSPAGGRVRGHVFHYSRVASPGGERFAYRLSKPKGIVGPWDGMVKGSALASYLHLHFGSNLDFAKGLALSCLGERTGPGTNDGPMS